MGSEDPVIVTLTSPQIRFQRNSSRNYCFTSCTFVGMTITYLFWNLSNVLMHLLSSLLFKHDLDVILNIFVHYLEVFCTFILYYVCRVVVVIFWSLIFSVKTWRDW